jgi:hypothetical protein
MGEPSMPPSKLLLVLRPLLSKPCASGRESGMPALVCPDGESRLAGMFASRSSRKAGGSGDGTRTVGYKLTPVVRPCRSCLLPLELLLEMPLGLPLELPAAVRCEK